MDCLQTATQQPLHMNKKILPHICLGALFTQDCFGVVPKFFVDMLLGNSFTDLFIREIFLSERKAVT